MTTNGPSTSLTGPSLRTLHRDLAAAQDDQIHRVLTIIDALAERGDADKLIAPLRGRIAELRPRRKLSLTRLLFTPLHPLIVDAAGWSSAAPSIPRTAILPLAGQVRDGLGATAATLDALAALHSSTDGIGELVGIGGELWPAAAKSSCGRADAGQLDGKNRSARTRSRGAGQCCIQPACPGISLIACCRQGDGRHRS